MGGSKDSGFLCYFFFYFYVRWPKATAQTTHLSTPTVFLGHLSSLSLISPSLQFFTLICCCCFCFTIVISLFFFYSAKLILIAYGKYHLLNLATETVLTLFEKASLISNHANKTLEARRWRRQWKEYSRKII